MKKGFTLVEILITLAIIVILTVVTVTAFSRSGSKETLNKDSAIILSYLTEARNNALTSVDNSEYGVHLTSTSATEFEGTTYSSGDSNNKTYDLSPSISLSSISLTGGTSNIYFSRLTGEPSATGTITILNSANNTSRVITIQNTGVVQLQ